VAWTEDFLRGRLGVRKNGGTINETPPNVINFRGKWTVFPNSLNAYIQYPPLHVLYQPGLTVAATMLVPTGASTGTAISQYDGAAYPANLQYILSVTPATPIVRSIFNISGSGRIADVAIPLDEEFRILVTWTTGGPILTYIDGVDQTAAPVNYAGAIGGTVQPLILGRRVDGSAYEGMLADPLVEFRGYSPDEALADFDRSTFV
jgi:hypothetical protein